MTSRRLNTPRSEAIVRCVALLAAIAAAAAPVRLTGHPAIDAVERALLAGAVTYIGAHGRRATGLLAALLVCVGARGPALALGLAALGVMAFGAYPARRSRDIGAVGIALLVQAPLWYRPDTWSFAPLAAIVALVAVLVSGVPHIRRRRRRVVRIGGVLLGAFIVIAAAGAAAGMINATSSVRDGTVAARKALTAARNGNSSQARSSLTRARERFSLAESRVESILTLPAGLVPGLAQQVDAVQAAIGEGQRISAIGDDLVATADYDSLKYSGRLDLTRVRALAAPTRRADQALRRAQEHLEDVQRGWLLPPLENQIESFNERLAEASRDTRLASSLLDVTPGLLGADGPRHYLVAFLTPAELRGGGGFVGSYAELEAVDGKVKLIRSGRTDELINAVPLGQRTLTGPADYLRRYGPYQPADFLQDATFSPDFPSDASVLAQLYPQSGGRKVDGVISVDPIGLAALLRLIGPVTVDGLAKPLTAANAAEVLLRQQYLESPDRAARGEILANATKVTFEKLTNASLPAPRRLSNVLSPVSRSGHLRMWSPDQREQELFEQLGADGSLVLPTGGDGLAVVQQNFGNNKLDAYLKRAITYQVNVDARTGQLRSTVKVKLTNLVPSTNLPPAVVANTKDAPAGTNVARMSLYTTQELVESTVDGQPLKTSPGTELGVNVWDTEPVLVPPGGSATVTFTLRGGVDLSEGYRFTLLPQPVAIPDRVSASLTITGGHVAGGNRRRMVLIPGQDITTPTTRLVELGLDS